MVTVLLVICFCSQDSLDYTITQLSIYCSTLHTGGTVHTELGYHQPNTVGESGNKQTKIQTPLILHNKSKVDMFRIIPSDGISPWEEGKEN